MNETFPADLSPAMQNTLREFRTASGKAGQFHSLPALAESGITVRSMRNQTNRLEELFVRLTAKEPVA